MRNGWIGEGHRLLIDIKVPESINNVYQHFGAGCVLIGVLNPDSYQRGYPKYDPLLLIFNKCPKNLKLYFDKVPN